MKVIVMGAGKVGYYLTQTLLEHGHEPVVIETSKVFCHRAANDLGVKVIWGDGSTIDTLAAAGIEDAGAFVSVTGSDEANLVACQLARRIFNVPKTVSRVNNPKNLSVMKRLGVDIPISSTDSLARMIEREVDINSIKQLITLNRGTATISEIVLPEDCPLEGKAISEVRLPEECVIISITRKGDLIIPRGRTVLRAGDVLLVLVSNEESHQLAKVLGVQK